LVPLVRFILWCALAAVSAAAPAQASAQEELLRTASEPGKRGGKLVIAQRSEPRTFNPMTAVD